MINNLQLKELYYNNKIISVFAVVIYGSYPINNKFPQ